MRRPSLAIFSLLGFVTSLALSGCSGTRRLSVPIPPLPTGTSPGRLGTHTVQFRRVPPPNATCVSANYGHHNHLRQSSGCLDASPPPISTVSGSEWRYMQ